MGPWKSSRDFTAWDFFLQLNFFIRFESPFLRPDPQCPNAVARRVCQGWPSLRYLLMLSAMPGQTLTNPSTAARSLRSDGRVEGSSLVAHEHSCRNLVFGGAATTPDHDAVLRIGSESSEAAARQVAPYRSACRCGRVRLIRSIPLSENPRSSASQFLIAGSGRSTPIL